MEPLTISQPEIDTFLNWLWDYWNWDGVIITYWNWIEDNFEHMNMN